MRVDTLRFDDRELRIEVIEQAEQFEQLRRIAADLDLACPDEFRECFLALQDFGQSRPRERQRNLSIRRKPT